MTDAALAHSQALIALIGARIRASGGWIGFDTFMDLALYAPGLGYYSAGSMKIGPAGDFITAPEVSSLFSECVAAQVAEVLSALRAHGDAALVTDAPRSGGAAQPAAAGDILELGAGTGRMAMDILLELERLDALPARYLILEVSAELRERQERTLAALPAALRARVAWLDTLPDQPLRGVVLANEVLDALPCRRVLLGGSPPEWLELGVAPAERDTFELAPRPADSALRAELERITDDLPHALAAPYATEICPRADAWLRSIAAVLGEGAMLLFDYGMPRRHYYHPERAQGTLVCHAQHRAHANPFAAVGLQDITAWVDFTRVAEAGNEAGLEVVAFCTQAAFLLGNGIEARIASATGAEQMRRSSAAQRLLLPGEMGEVFKVMALTRGLDAPLAGFELQDLRHQL